MNGRGCKIYSSEKHLYSIIGNEQLNKQEVVYNIFGKNRSCIMAIEGNDTNKATVNISRLPSGFIFLKVNNKVIKILKKIKSIALIAEFYPQKFPK